MDFELRAGLASKFLPIVFSFQYETKHPNNSIHDLLVSHNSSSFPGFPSLIFTQVSTSSRCSQTSSKWVLLILRPESHGSKPICAFNLLLPGGSRANRFCSLEGLPFPNEEFDFVYLKRIALGVPEDKVAIDFLF